MGVDDDDNITSMMEAALEQAPKEMITLVKRRDQELKVRIGCRDWCYIRWGVGGV